MNSELKKLRKRKSLQLELNPRDQARLDELEQQEQRFLHQQQQIENLHNKIEEYKREIANIENRNKRLQRDISNSLFWRYWHDEAHKLDDYVKNKKQIVFNYDIIKHPDGTVEVEKVYTDENEEIDKVVFLFWLQQNEDRLQIEDLPQTLTKIYKERE